MIRRAMATLVPKFTTWRMVQEYTQKYYLPGHALERGAAGHPEGIRSH
jgi:hypothetical protein